MIYLAHYPEGFAVWHLYYFTLHGLQLCWSHKSIAYRTEQLKTLHYQRCYLNLAGQTNTVSEGVNNGNLENLGNGNNGCYYAALATSTGRSWWVGSPRSNVFQTI